MKTYWARALVLASGLALLLGLGLPLRAIAWETEDHRGKEAEEHRDREAKECEKSTFPATGQTTPYTADTLKGAGTKVADDGTVKAGGPLRYKDNGDGTITDRNTGLMWEKKSLDLSLHDATVIDTTFPWSSLFPPSRGTIWDWLDKVNGKVIGYTPFAGHKDWRIPNVKELQSIVDYERFSPAVDPKFNKDVSPGCTVLTCSVTAGANGNFYWSSTTQATTGSTGTFAWFVEFDTGFVFSAEKSVEISVRAVRGGCVTRAKEKEKEKEKEKDWSSGRSHR